MSLRDPRGSNVDKPLPKGENDAAAAATTTTNTTTTANTPTTTTDVKPYWSAWRVGDAVHVRNNGDRVWRIGTISEKCLSCPLCNRVTPVIAMADDHADGFYCPCSIVPLAERDAVTKWGGFEIGSIVQHRERPTNKPVQRTIAWIDTRCMTHCRRCNRQQPLIRFAGDDDALPVRVRACSIELI